jgi:hypothetical protein
LSADVFDSPAVMLLADLEAEGFSVTVTDDGVLRIAPRSRLSPERMQSVATHRHDLSALVRLCDDGVQARRQCFRQLLDQHFADGRLPALLYRQDVAYIAGSCFSCGDTLDRPRYGRCWRCAVAMRLALRVPISPDTMAAHKDAKVAG